MTFATSVKLTSRRDIDVNVRKSTPKKDASLYIYYLKNYLFDFHTIQSVGRTHIVLGLQIFSAQNTTEYGHESIRRVTNI